MKNTKRNCKTQQKNKNKKDFVLPITPHFPPSGSMSFGSSWKSISDNKLGSGKSDPMWLGLHIVKRVLAKGAYELIDFYGVPLV